MSNALKFGFALQFPEIMDKGLSTVISEAGLFKTFINGDSGFIASSPGRIEASFFVSTAAAIRFLKAVYAGFAASPVL